MTMDKTAEIKMTAEKNDRQKKQLIFWRIAAFYIYLFKSEFLIIKPIARSTRAIPKI